MLAFVLNYSKIIPSFCSKIKNSMEITPNSPIQSKPWSWKSWTSLTIWNSMRSGSSNMSRTWSIAKIYTKITLLSSNSVLIWRAVSKRWKKRRATFRANSRWSESMLGNLRTSCKLSGVPSWRKRKEILNFKWGVISSWRSLQEKRSLLRTKTINCWRGLSSLKRVSRVGKMKRWP